MPTIHRSSKVIILILITLLLAMLPACGATQEFMPETSEDTGARANPPDEDSGLPPGSFLPGGDSAMPADDQPVAATEETGHSQSTGGPLKPVRFRNLGSAAYTVTPWSYISLDPTVSGFLSDASTAAFPGGSNPSAYLELPLGTYTWCYHWELGDTNGDGMIDYAHAIDGRPVTLDQNDSDDTTLAESVDLSAPTFAGEMPGQCDQSASQAGSLPPRPPMANGELLFADDGSGGTSAMFSAEYMSFGYQGGQAQLTANAANFVLPAMYSAAGSFSNLIVEVDFTAFSGGAGGQYSLIFRSDDVDGGLASYYIVALIPGSRTIELAVWRDGWQGTLVSAIEDQAISLAPPLRFRLEAVGNEFAVFINGAFAAGFSDSQIGSAGIIGMSITTDQAPGSYAYDNLRVYALP